MKNLYHIFKDFIKGSPEKEILPNKESNIEKLMYTIDRPEPTQFFMDVRQMAGIWLQKEIDKLPKAHWLKTDLTYPSFEHLSIAYKNQIFCILIDIINKNTNKSFLPKHYIETLVKECLKNNLVPCLYKIFVDNPLNPAYNTMQPISSGWNLYNAITNLPISIDEIATDAPIRMSDWELNDFAIQMARDFVNKQTPYRITSYQTVEGIDPQIWVENNKGEHIYIVVRYAMFPKDKAAYPENIESIKLSCKGYNGYFLSVGFYSQGQYPDILCRGDGAYCKIEELEPIK